jgi:hypothetical protein
MLLAWLRRDQCCILNRIVEFVQEHLRFVLGIGYWESENLFMRSPPITGEKDGVYVVVVYVVLTYCSVLHYSRFAISLPEKYQALCVFRSLPRL